MIPNAAVPSFFNRKYKKRKISSKIIDNPKELEKKLVVPVVEYHSKRKLREVCFAKIQKKDPRLVSLFQFQIDDTSSHPKHIEAFALQDLANDADYATVFGHNLFQWASLHHKQFFLDKLYNYYAPIYPNNFHLMIACNQMDALQSIIDTIDLHAAVALAFQYGHLTLLKFFLQRIDENERSSLQQTLLFGERKNYTTPDCLFPEMLDYLLDQYIEQQNLRANPDRVLSLLHELLISNRTRIAITLFNKFQFEKQISQASLGYLLFLCTQQKNIYLSKFLIEHYIEQFEIEDIYRTIKIDGISYQHSLLHLYLLLLLEYKQYDILKEIHSKYLIDWDFVITLIDERYQNHRYDAVVTLILCFENILQKKAAHIIPLLLQTYEQTSREDIKENIKDIFRNDCFRQKKYLEVLFSKVLQSKNQELIDIIFQKIDLKELLRYVGSYLRKEAYLHSSALNKKELRVAIHHLQQKATTTLSSEESDFIQQVRLLTLTAIADKNIIFLNFLKDVEFDFNFFSELSKHDLLELIPELAQYSYTRYQDYSTSRDFSVATLMRQNSVVFEKPFTVNLEHQVEISPYIMMLLLNDENLSRCLSGHLNINYASPLTSATTLSFMIKHRRYKDAITVIADGAQCVISQDKNMLSEFLTQEFTPSEYISSSSQFLKFVKSCYVDLLIQLQSQFPEKYKIIYNQAALHNFLNISVPTLTDFQNYFNKLPQEPYSPGEMQTVFAQKYQLFITLLKTYLTEMSLTPSNHHTTNNDNNANDDHEVNTRSNWLKTVLN